MLKTNPLNHLVTFGNTSIISISTHQFLPESFTAYPRLLTTYLFSKYFAFVFKPLNVSSVPNSFSLTYSWSLSSPTFILMSLHMIRKCLNKDVFPSVWKIDSVTTIFKSGDSSSVVCNQLQTYFYVTSHC